MTRDGVAAVIERIRRAESNAQARQLVRTIAPFMSACDAQLRGELASVLESRGLDAGVARVPLALGVGESWLLLHAGGSEGRVSRVVASATEAAGARVLPEQMLVVPMRALASMAARAGRRLPDAIHRGVSLATADDLADVSGRSLDVTAAVALLSHALGRPPVATVAGTARLELDGTLTQVSHVSEKLAALSRAFPDVRTVIVARDQPLPDHDLGISVVRARTLADALPSFGLTLEDLPHGLVEDQQEHADSFHRVNMEVRAPEDWRRLSFEAWERSIALAEHDAERSITCRAWAALFALHAGDANDAHELARDVDPGRLAGEPEAHALLLIVRASASIDRDRFDEAREDAKRALGVLEALGRREQAALAGQARGTLGRALMHAGRYAEAEPHLRHAAEHHREHAPRERPRSLSYLSTCLRHAGRPTEALTVIDEAIAQNAHHLVSTRVARVTEHYLRLERGRVLLELGSFDDAERDLLAVMPGSSITAYPRLGAERSLVRLGVRAGHHARALEAFRRCAAAASELVAAGVATTIARVAAVGIGEGLCTLRVAEAEREDAARLYERAFGAPLTEDGVSRISTMWIF